MRNLSLLTHFLEKSPVKLIFGLIVLGRQTEPGEICMDANIDESEIRSQLLRLVASEPLKSSPQLVTFLTYVVEQVIEGNERNVKAYTIAVDALNRPTSFDPMSDPLVRVLATRLRRILDAYYSAQGNADPIIICLPKGTYVPTIERRSSATANSELQYEDAQRHEKGDLRSDEIQNLPKEPLSKRHFFTGSVALLFIAILGLGGLFAYLWQSGKTSSKAAINTVGITPFSHDPGNEQQVKISSSIEADLARRLQRGSFLSVRMLDGTLENNLNDSDDNTNRQDVRFVIKGNLREDNADGENAKNKLILSLIYNSSGEILWSEEYQFSVPFSSQEYSSVIKNIGYDFNPAYYAAVKGILDREGVDEGSAIELFISSNWIPGIAVSSLSWEKERVRLAQEALKIDPDFGPAHAVLADKLAYLATVDPPSDTQENILQSKVHAAKALAFADQQADALYNIISHNLHIGNIKAAERLANRVAEIDPKNVLAEFYVKSMALTCKAASDEELSEVISFHNGLNSRNPARWITATTIARIELNRQNYMEAVKWGRESEKIFQSLGAAFQLAAALVQTGDITSAANIMERQKGNWPNIDASHFANVVIPRRCGNYDTVNHLQKIYQDLANATGY